MIRRMTGIMTALAFLGLTASPAAAFGNSTSYEKTALSGQEIYVFMDATLNPDCSSMGKNEIRAVSGPSHGNFRLVSGTIYPNYSKANERYKCNARKVQGTRGLYRSKPGFKGHDQVTLSIHTVTGNAHTVVVSINVE